MRYILLAFLLVSPRGVLRVGQGQPFARIEDALAKAQPGDVIEVYPGAYEKVALFVTQKNLTFKSMKGRIKLSGKGFDYSGEGRTPRAIFQFNPGADGCRVEGFELTGATNKSDNGAGVRNNGAKDVTIFDCDIHGNDMGIMSNACANFVIEQCHIHENGSDRSPGLNHNLYLGGESVVVRFCDIHHSLTGHNVKSRAHVTRVEFCYIHESANREFDLVDAQETAKPESHAFLVGNVIVKAKDMKGNKTLAHFGQDGGGEHDGTIHFIHNTIVQPYISPIVELSAPKAKAHFVGNVISGTNGGKISNQPDRATGSSNAISKGVDVGKLEAPLAQDFALNNFRLTASIQAPAPKDVDLSWEYKHPCGKEKRKNGKKVELGAYGR
jgi:hypothetical protein